MKNLLRNKKYIGLILVAVIAFNFLFLPLTASAIEDAEPASAGGLVSWISGKVLLFISSMISMLFSALFGWIIGLEAQIIDYILNPDNFSFINAPIVTTGWGITRDLANMFLILILLIIAFATVLRIQSYAIKQLWWKVLVAALLINFSLVIAGFVVDFTQVLTTFFVKQAIGGGGIGTITTRLMAGMQILNFYDPAPAESAIGGATQLGATAIAAAIGPILTLIGLIITAFVFGAAVVFLIVRILYIWFLLILAPIVWMLWILPATSKYFSEWWNKFIQWAFFAPIFVFMIYLSLSIFATNGQLKTDVFSANTSPAWGTALKGFSKVTMPSAIFQWILVIAMMFGSLIMAQGFGIKIAAGAQKILTGWGTATKNWAGRQLRKGYVRATKPEAPTPPPAGASIGQRLGYHFRQVGAAVGKGMLATPILRGQQLEQIAKDKAAYAADYDKYKNLDPAALSAISAGFVPDARQRLAMEQVKIEKDISKPTADEAKNLLNQAQKYGQEEKFLDLITSKDSFSPDYGYNVPEINDMLDRAKKYGKEEKLLGIVSNKLIGRKKGQIKPDADQLKGLLDRSEQYPNQMRKMFDTITDTEKLGAKGLKDYKDSDLENLVQRADKQGKAEDLLKIFPQFYSSSLKSVESKSISEIIGKIKAAETSKLSAKALDNADVVTAMTEKFIGDHIMNLAQEGRLDIIDKMKKEIDSKNFADFENTNPRLAKWIEKSPANIFFTKPEKKSEKETKE